MRCIAALRRVSTFERRITLSLFVVVLAAADRVIAQELLADFEWVWETTRSQFYDSTTVEQYFSKRNHAALAELVRSARSADDLAAIINPMLDSLQTSHTRLLTESDPEY